MTESGDGGQSGRVGIGLVGRAGRFLIRQRPPGSAMAGYWEFPGGKCEPGESPADATLRECREELGISVVLGPLRRMIRHRYPHAWVELYYFDCVTADPLAEPGPGTGFRWVPAAELPALPFPRANDPIVHELAAEAHSMIFPPALRPAGRRRSEESS
jgi:mutator protein MutT